MKRADVDIEPFGEHDKTDTQPDETGKTIPFTLGGVIEGGSTLEPEQGTSFGGGKTQRTRLKESFIEKFYRMVSEETGQTPEAFHFDNFKHMENCTTQARVHL